MKVIAKCHNYSGCLKAYKGEFIEIASDAPLVCPECSKPLTPVASKGARVAKSLAVGLVAVTALGAAVYYGAPFLKNSPSTPTASGEKSPAVSQTGLSKSAEPAAEPAEPPTTIVAPEKLDLATASAENKKIKSEVLTRIDLMPNIGRASKDKLYNSVERARSMGKVLTIPFGPGKVSLAQEDIDTLKSELGSPELLKLRDDPTAVFVLLGYADPKGDKQKNISVSQARADIVLNAMKDKCGVTNVMHSVAMGSSTILDSQNLEKNRIVEIWAVLP
jgi:outer membrane protein OmpA-like peptidoglycan-associated protein